MAKIKFEIIPIQNKEIRIFRNEETPYITHIDIANYTHNTLDSVYRLVVKHKEELERFGILGFEIRKIKDNNGEFKKGRPQEVYYLNEMQTTFLVMLMRNNPIVVEFKFKVVKAFFEALSWIKDRDANKYEYKLMCSQIKAQRELLGKDTTEFHYSNEANLINRMVIGCSAGDYCELNNIDRSQLRNNLTDAQLNTMLDLERFNTALISTGMEYEQRKQLLEKRYSQILAKLLN